MKRKIIKRIACAHIVCAFAFAQSAFGISGESGQIADSAVIDGDLNINSDTVAGIKLSGDKLVTLAPGAEDAVVTITGRYGIDMSGSTGAAPTLELGKVIINKDDATANSAIVISGPGSKLVVGEGSHISSLGGGAGVSVYVGATADIGKNSTIIGTNWGGVMAAAASKGGILNIGDGATIINDGASRVGEDYGLRRGVLAHADGTVNIGKNSVIKTTDDGGTQNHAVVAGYYYYYTHPSTTPGATPGSVYIDSGANISTDGTEAYALTSTLAGSYIEVKAGATLTTTGDNSHAVFADYGGTIKLEGAKIRATGNGSNAIVARSFLADTPTTVTGQGVFDIEGKIVAITTGEVERGNRAPIPFDGDDAIVDLTMEAGSVFKGSTHKDEKGRIDIAMSGSKWTITENSVLSDFVGNASSTLVFTLNSVSDFVTLTADSFSLENSIVKIILGDLFAADINDTFAIVLGDAYNVNDISFDFSEAKLAAGLYWDTSTFAVDGTLRIGQVPEPAGFVALAGILAAFVALRKRREK